MPPLLPKRVIRFFSGDALNSPHDRAAPIPESEVFEGVLGAHPLRGRNGFALTGAPPDRLLAKASCRALSGLSPYCGVYSTMGSTSTENWNHHMSSGLCAVGVLLPQRSDCSDDGVPSLQDSVHYCPLPRTSSWAFMFRASGTEQGSFQRVVLSFHPPKANGSATAERNHLTRRVNLHASSGMTINLPRTPALPLLLHHSGPPK